MTFEFLVIGVPPYLAVNRCEVERTIFVITKVAKVILTPNNNH